MIRVRTLFLTVLPSMVAGGFLFASAFGHAETGRDLGAWPAQADTATGRVLVAQADPWGSTPRTRRTPPVPPVPPVAPVAPTYGAPVPPVPPPRMHGRNRGLSVSVHDGKVQVEGLAEMIEGQLEGVSAMLDALPDVPPEVRDRVKQRVKAVRRTVNHRLSKLKGMDVNQIGPEMEQMGDEIEREMEGLDKDLEQLGDKIGKRVAAQLGQQLAKSFRDVDNDNDRDDDDHDASDDDDHDAAVMAPGPNVDPSDVTPQIASLKNLTLKPDQKAQLAKIRAEADSQLRTAKAALDEASSALRTTLGDASASEGEIARQIDLVSRQEATIRKARILAWVKARNMLDKDQRKQIEAAAKHH